MPSLNWHTPEVFRNAARQAKARTSKLFAVNLTVNQSNPRQPRDLAICAEERVRLVIISLDPKIIPWIRTYPGASNEALGYRPGPATSFDT